MEHVSLAVPRILNGNASDRHGRLRTPPARPSDPPADVPRVRDPRSPASDRCQQTQSHRTQRVTLGRTAAPTLPRSAATARSHPPPVEARAPALGDVRCRSPHAGPVGKWFRTPSDDQRAIACASLAPAPDRHQPTSVPTRKEHMLGAKALKSFYERPVVLSLGPNPIVTDDVLDAPRLRALANHGDGAAFCQLPGLAAAAP